MGRGHDLGKGQARTMSGDITLEGRLSGASSGFPGQHGLGEEGHLEKGDPGQARGAAWQAGPGQEHSEGPAGACSPTSSRSRGAGWGPERRRVDTSPCSPWPRCPASSPSGLEGAWPRGAPGPGAPLLWHVASCFSLGLVPEGPHPGGPGAFSGSICGQAFSLFVYESVGGALLR